MRVCRHVASLRESRVSPTPSGKGSFSVITLNASLHLYISLVIMSGLFQDATHIYIIVLFSLFTLPFAYSIRRMRVSKFASICTSRYGREKRKC